MNFKAILITAWIWFPALATAYKTEIDPFPVCDSPECNKRAKLLNESLSTTTDPCTDFYSYVCGGWESNHQSPNFKGSYDVYKEIVKDIPEKLSYILGNRSVVESNQTILDKMAIMYNACLEMPDSRDALIKVLNESGFNSWPILTKQNIFNSSNCTELLRHIGISAILYVDIIDMKSYARNPANPYVMTIKDMPVQYEIKKISNIGVLINNTIKLLSPGIEIAMLENLTNQLVEFANNLSKISKQIWHDGYNTSLLKSKFPNIPISDLLKKEFGKVNITLNDADRFSVSEYYCRDLEELLGTTNPNTLYNYAGFLQLFPYLEYLQMSKESEFTVNTTKSRNWSECITLLDKSAPDILDYLYVTNEPNHSAIKNEVKDIAHRLQQALNEMLQNNSWLGNKTRQTLQKKLEEVTVGIGYPEILLNISLLETRYQYVPLFPLDISLTEALYHIKENSYKMSLRKLRYPFEGDLGWDHSSRKGRLSHDERWTKIEIPYALLVSPFFQQRLPRSLNYGGIGGAVASALAHAISIIDDPDNVRRKYKNSMTQDSVALYKNLTSCFLKQYKAFDKKLLLELDDKYSENTSAEAAEHQAFFAKSDEYKDCYLDGFRERHNLTQESSNKTQNATEECLQYWREYFQRHDNYWPNLLVNWGLTLNEDVADNTGLHTAFNAYKKILEEECDGHDTRLNGLEDFSGMQLFFISKARTQCRIASNDILISEIRWSEYSTARNRVNGAMKNLEEFAKAFNCSIGSPMNPGKNETCSFW